MIVKQQPMHLCAQDSCPNKATKKLPALSSRQFEIIIALNEIIAIQYACAVLRINMSKEGAWTDRVMYLAHYRGVDESTFTEIFETKACEESLSYRRPADLKVVCDNGLAFVDLPNTVAWFDSAGQHLETLDHERPVGEQLLMHFHRAVESLVLKTASLDDAHRALAIASKARQSCATGQRVYC